MDFEAPPTPFLSLSGDIAAGYYVFTLYIFIYIYIYMLQQPQSEGVVAERHIFQS